MAVPHADLLLQKLRVTSELLAFRFAMAPFDIHADGEIDGISTRLAWEPSGISGDITIHGRFFPSLGLGLRAVAPECDAEPRAFTTTADDLTIAAQLVNDDILAALAPVSSDSAITISDHEVVLRRSAARSFEPADLAAEVRAIAAAAAVIARRREALPALSLLAAHAESAAQFAEANGLRALRQPPAVMGARPYGYIQCGLERVVRSRYTLAGRVSLSNAALRSISLTPSQHVGLLSRAWSGITGSDIRVGEPVFDAAYVIHAPSVAVAHDALSPDVCQAILDIGQRYGDLTMHSGVINVGPAEVDLTKSESVAWLAGALDSLCAKLP